MYLCVCTVHACMYIFIYRNDKNVRRVEIYDVPYRGAWFNVGLSLSWDLSMCLPASVSISFSMRVSVYVSMYLTDALYELQSNYCISDIPFYWVLHCTDLHCNTL